MGGGIGGSGRPESGGGPASPGPASTGGGIGGGGGPASGMGDRIPESSGGPASRGAGIGDGTPESSGGGGMGAMMPESCGVSTLPQPTAPAALPTATLAAKTAARTIAGPLGFGVNPSSAIGATLQLVSASIHG